MWSLLAASSGIFADAGSGTTADLAEGEVLLQEDFSDPSSESFVSGAFPEGYEMGSVGGAYRIAVNNARLGAVSSIGHERMESLRLELEATEVTGGSADFVGVRCYTDLESNEGYAVGVNPAARGYRVDAFNRDDFRLLESSDAPADAVRRLGDENHMQVVCDSSSKGPTVVTLAVNGQMLVRAEDGRGSRGGFDGIGLFVQTAEDSAAAEALFDDMTLTGVGADRAAREWLRILGIAAAYAPPRICTDGPSGWFPTGRSGSPTRRVWCRRAVSPLAAEPRGRRMRAR
jgi:hypothetical protein